MNCTKTKRIIDEADRPDVFPLEAAGHVDGCPDCRSFADERAKLRELTGSMARVAAPSNFNARLNERLSQVKAQRWSWLSPAGFLRLGTATAGLAVVFIALQYGGFLSSGTPKDDQRANVAPNKFSSETPSVQPTPDVVPIEAPKPQVTVAGLGKPLTRPIRAVNVAPSKIQRVSPQDGPPALLVRDRNGDRTVPMMPVSVGMQLQVINSSYGRQQRSSDVSY